MAIDYKQLRAGNLVANHKGEVHVITPWDIWNLECYFTKNMVADKRLEEWRYIPLDEEWLQRFGFAFRLENGRRIQAFIGDNPVTHDWLFDIKIVYDYWFYRNGHHRIDYVHQLQNLYHSLTGVELEVKL